MVIRDPTQKDSLIEGKEDLKSQSFELIRNHQGIDKKIAPKEAQAVRSLQSFASGSTLKVYFTLFSAYASPKSKSGYTWRNLDNEYLTYMVENHPYSLIDIRLAYPSDYLTEIPILPPSPLTELPVECASIPYLVSLRLEGIPLTSLKNLPPVKDLAIRTAIFSDLIDCPKTITNVETLNFQYCWTLKSLEGLPRVMPHLKRLSFFTCHLQSLSDLPRMPQLKFFTCTGSFIRNFAGLNRIPKYTLQNIQYNKIISPHRMPGDQYQSIFFNEIQEIQSTLKNTPHEFPPTYLPKLDLDHHTWQEIRAFFVPDPTTLAVQYAKGDNLSKFALDRIWAEGTMETLRYLVQHVPPTDSVLVKLAQRWKFPLSPKDILL
jgi:hypothetical protein